VKDLFVLTRKMKGGEKMKKCLAILLTVFLCMAFSTTVYAAASKTINVTASIPQMSGGLSVTVSKVRASDDTWVQSDANLPINFETLTFDDTYKIFRASYYYAVDVGITDNSGTNWTITHTRTNFQKDASNNLNNCVNVSFMKQVNDTTATQLQKLSYNNSNNVSFTKSQLSGGWLRIYYGIATGQGDASGVVPIGLDKPYGTYSGQVTITVTP
jgi:hypothetical protein